MIDESLERELFALRAPTIATPRLDLEDVLARAEHPWRAPHRASRLAAFASALACAAASYLAVAPAPSGHVEESTSATMSYFDGLSCRSDVPDVAVANAGEPSMCVAKAELVCDVTLQSSRP